MLRDDVRESSRTGQRSYRRGRDVDLLSLLARPERYTIDKLETGSTISRVVPLKLELNLGSIPDLQFDALGILLLIMNNGNMQVLSYSDQPDANSITRSIPSTGLDEEY